MDIPVHIIPYKCNLSKEQMIRFQVMLYAFFQGIELTRTDVNTLTLLGLMGPQDQMTFCKETVKRNVYMSIQAARNAISRLCAQKGVLQKSGGHRKTIRLHDSIQVTGKSNTLLDIKCIYQEKAVV